jgi:DNA-binding NtrC family response regulator
LKLQLTVKDMGLTILCIGQASAAQITRNLVLERAGYRVVSTEDPQEAERVFSSDDISAVVFGETIRPQQHIDLGSMFKRIRPAVPIVFLYRMSGFRVPPGIADEQVEFLRGPKLLLQALDRVLGKTCDDLAEEED